jgi:hypothetical protein
LPDKDDKGEAFGTARIEGRRGNIRAGSVSGPWRSGAAPDRGRREAPAPQRDAEPPEERPDAPPSPGMAFEPRAKRASAPDGRMAFAMTVAVALVVLGLILAGIGLLGLGGEPAPGAPAEEPAAGPEG